MNADKQALSGIAGIPSAHTPGPWLIGNGGHPHGAEFEVRADPDGEDWYITGVPWGDDIYDTAIPRFVQAEANARLIAAAPELLESLLTLTTFADGVIALVDLTDTNGIVAAARAIIAKATGQ